jgi:hypothetical protein
MTKRASEYVSGSATNVYKRPRTRSFLEKHAQYKNVLETCTFFANELNNHLNTTPSNATKDPLMASPGHLEGIRSAADEIRKEVLVFEEGFRSLVETLGSEADDSIRLGESFRCMAKAIESPGKDDDNGIPCSISMLNQGPETNTALKDLVATYAGVPTKCESEDWKDLRSHLPPR